MKVCVTYVFPTCVGEHYLASAVRFLTTYANHHPGMEHDSVIVCNGGEPTEEIKFMFEAAMPNCRFLVRDNSGYDIGGFQQAAQECPCDLMVFFGSTAYLRGTGWLVRMLQAFAKHGPALYGVHGNRGDGRVSVWPHLRTTGMWCSPDLMNRYPHRITKAEQRYSFEHGKTSFGNWIKSQRLKMWCVSWDGEYEEPMWDSIPGGFHRDRQQGLIVGDRLTEPPFYAHP